MPAPRPLHETYPPGSRWRVLKPGLRLSGWRPTGPGTFQGVGRELHPGDVIECDGFGPGWGSDPGYGINWRDPEYGKCDLWPAQGSAFSYHPPDGYLERVDGEEEEEA